jgi:hypothetical protein
VQTRDLVPEVARFDPHPVIRDRPGAVDPGGLRRSIENPESGDLLAFVDEAESLLRGCRGPKHHLLARLGEGSSAPTFAVCRARSHPHRL